jgi:hypothetical protein
MLASTVHCGSSESCAIGNLLRKRTWVVNYDISLIITHVHNLLLQSRINCGSVRPTLNSISSLQGLIRIQ